MAHSLNPAGEIRQPQLTIFSPSSCRYTNNIFNVRLDVQVLQLPLLEPVSLSIGTVTGFGQSGPNVMTLNNLPWHVAVAPGLGTVHQTTYWVMNAGSTNAPGSNTTVAQLVSNIGQNTGRFNIKINTNSAPNGAVKGSFVRL